MLDPDVVGTSDGRGRAIAARKPLHGGARVARAWAALTPKFVREPIEITLNGQLGRVLPSGDGHRAALSFAVSDGRVARIDAIRNPEKLRHLSNEAPRDEAQRVTGRAPKRRDPAGGEDRRGSIGRSPPAGLLSYGDQPAFRAARRMSFVTFAGCEM